MDLPQPRQFGLTHDRFASPTQRSRWRNNRLDRQGRRAADRRARAEGPIGRRTPAKRRKLPCLSPSRRWTNACAKRRASTPRWISRRGGPVRARPEEIARAVVFLASEEGGFITGSTLPINNGQYMM
jgi:NAD(P)-dependent dehydrogenase (short-subunit alcohol dehydrogenase family)